MAQNYWFPKMAPRLVPNQTKSQHAVPCSQKKVPVRMENHLWNWKHFHGVFFPALCLFTKILLEEIRLNQLIWKTSHYLQGFFTGGAGFLASNSISIQKHVEPQHHIFRPTSIPSQVTCCLWRHQTYSYAAPLCQLTDSVTQTSDRMICCKTPKSDSPVDEVVVYLYL